MVQCPRWYGEYDRESPQNEQSTKVGVATGSRNLQEASIDTTGQFGDSDFSYRLIALARKQDSQVDNAEEERYLIAPSVDWQATDSTLVNFNLYYQKILQWALTRQCH